MSFNTISFFPSDMSIVSDESDPQKSKKYGDYIVDTSSFVPMSEAVKRVTGGTLSKDDIQSMYDFADGKDTGQKVPIDRTHRFLSGDIAEMSVEVKAAEKAAKESLDRAYDDYQFEQKLNAVNGDNTANSNGNE